MRCVPAFLVCAAALFAAPHRRIMTIAGSGVAGYSGDGGPPASAELSNPYGISIGPDGAIYFCEVDNHCVRRLDLRGRELSTVAGNRRPGYSGDHGPALSASLNEPYDIRFDSAGNMFIVERLNHDVRRVDAKTKVITTVAGNGRPGFSGDGGPGARAQLRLPTAIEFDPHGRLLICDAGNNRIRRLDLKTGMIETWAGTGDKRPTPDGAALIAAPFSGPRALDVDPKGNVFVTVDGNVVLRIDALDNHVHVVAGTGERGYSGDNGPARVARLNGPVGLAWAPDNSLFVADTDNNVIRLVDLRTGIITTVAGTGERGDGADGDPLKCKLAAPHGIATGRRGAVLIGDSENHRIRLMREIPPPEKQGEETRRARPAEKAPAPGEPKSPAEKPGVPPSEPKAKPPEKTIPPAAIGAKHLTPSR